MHPPEQYAKNKNQPALIPLPSGAIIELWPKPSATTLLFYPGSLLGPAQYSCILRRFFQAGFSIAALHLSGHGLNIKKSPISPASLLQEGLEAEAWLLNNSYYEIAVSGHSQGAILALAHAAASGNLVAAFPISAAFPQLPLAIRLTRFSPFQNKRKEILGFINWLGAVLPWLPIPLPFYLSLKKIVKGRKKPVAIGNGPSRISYPLQFLAALFSTNISTCCRCPVWLISAKNDALFTPEIISESFAAIQAPIKHLVWLEDGGHMAPMNPKIADFIARTAACECAGLGSTLHLEKDRHEISWTGCRVGKPRTTLHKHTA